MGWAHATFADYLAADWLVANDLSAAQARPLFLGPDAFVAEDFAGIEGAAAVLLFGSWAARYLGEPGRAPNDIDVLVIGEPDRDAVDDAAKRAERRIGLPVQATVRTRE